VKSGTETGKCQLTAAGSSTSHPDVLVVAFDYEGLSRFDRCTNDLAGECDECGDNERIIEHVGWDSCLE
jgi:hypothetical protein